MMGQISEQTANPVGLDGVDFVEYAGGKAAYFENLFKAWGFTEVGSIPGKNIKLFRQNDINFILNMEPGTFAATFAKSHGPSICSTGFRVKDAKHAFETAVARGGKPYKGSD